MAKLIYYYSAGKIGMQLIHDDSISRSVHPTAIFATHELTQEQARLPLNELRLIFRPRIRVPYRKG